ncbi:MAG: hypothetical protein RIT14_2898, partial [Pseudomonadota bacterium]
MTQGEPMPPGPRIISFDMHSARTAQPPAVPAPVTPGLPPPLRA